MKIAIYGQVYKDSLSHINTLFKVLQQKPVSVFIEDVFWSKVNGLDDLSFDSSDFQTFTSLDKSYDLSLIHI